MAFPRHQTRSGWAGKAPLVTPDYVADQHWFMETAVLSVCRLAYSDGKTYNQPQPRRSVCKKCRELLIKYNVPHEIPLPRMPDATKSISPA